MLSPYQQYIHLSKYARWLDVEQRRETWHETVARWLQYFDDHAANLTGETALLSSAGVGHAIEQLHVMPSMRALMTAGPALDSGLIANYNCSYMAVSDVRAFDEAMLISMHGTGVGYSVERQLIAKLPVVADTIQPIDYVIVVEDSRIGWSTALRELIGMLYAGLLPKWDVSKVRPAGSRLKTFGGRASGPEPLVSLFKHSVNTFKNAAGRKLNSLECHDLMCKIAECVVSGSVRRSAMLSLSNLSDERMRDCKSGEWWSTAPYRAMANNSVAYTEKPEIGRFMREWLALYEAKSGERGIFNRDGVRKHLEKIKRDTAHDFGVNPCVTGDTKVLTYDGYKRVSELVDTPFKAIVNGACYNSGGFWSTGVKPVYMVKTSAGHSVRATANHKFLLADGTWREAKYLVGASVALNTHLPSTLGDHVSEVISVEPDGEAEVFDCTVEHISRFGANGLIAHNCGEILLRPQQFCNLSSVVIRADDTSETLAHKVRLATIIGTVQSTLTDFRYLRPEWQANCEAERLLGVSLSGIMDHPVLREVSRDAIMLLEHLRRVARETNRLWSQMLGINESAAITCVKPEGNSSQLVNSSSGIHPRHSRYYIRRVRQALHDPLTEFMIDSGVPHAPDYTNSSTVVFEFPVESPAGAVTRDDRTAVQQLNHWLMFREHWCEHNPSITVTVREHEWLEAGAWVYRNFDQMSGVSFLPHSDHTYQQAPYEAIDKATYDDLASKMPKIDWSYLRDYESTENTSTGNEHEFACTGGACEIR